MAEANATVDPFESAGVVLPTQGVAYAEQVFEAGNPVPIPATAIAYLPRSSIDPTPIGVTIPHAVEGEVLDIAWNVGMLPDAAGVPATLGLVAVLIEDAALNTYLPEQSTASTILTASGLLFGLASAGIGFAVPPGMVFPITVRMIYLANGDALFGGFAGCAALRVRRMKRTNVLQMPLTTFV